MGQKSEVLITGLHMDLLIALFPTPVEKYLTARCLYPSQTTTNEIQVLVSVYFPVEVEGII